MKIGGVGRIDAESVRHAVIGHIGLNTQMACFENQRPRLFLEICPQFGTPLVKLPCSVRRLERIASKNFGKEDVPMIGGENNRAVSGARQFRHRAL